MLFYRNLFFLFVDGETKIGVVTLVLLYVVGGICSIKLTDPVKRSCTHLSVLSHHLPMIKVMCFGGKSEKNVFFFIFNERNFWISFWWRAHATSKHLDSLECRARRSSCWEFGAHFFYLCVLIITVLMNKIRGFHSSSARKTCVMKFSCWINHKSKASINFNWKDRRSFVQWMMDK